LDNHTIPCLKTRDSISNAIQHPRVLFYIYSIECDICNYTNAKVEEWQCLHKDTLFYKLDTYEIDDLLDELDVIGVPMFKIYNNGVCVDNIIGFLPDRVEKHLK
jgi:hypothetical protein